jgi:hypothetical protein
MRILFTLYEFSCRYKMRTFPIEDGITKPNFLNLKINSRLKRRLYIASSVKCFIENQAN